MINQKNICSLLLIYIILFNSTIVYALEVVPDGSTNTKVYESINNKTPVIEIAEPNDKGVSLNRYDDYNVDQRNLVINNSNIPIISKFVGAIDRNSNFNNNTEATIIVNEVTSERITELNGYTEIAGRQAELIIANPNGIITKEAGFINTSRLGLIVGKNTDIDKLEFEIDKRNELIVADTLDTTDIDYTTLIARVVKLQKEITAKALVIQTGNNKAERLDTGEYKVTSATKQEEDKPALSIDASVFGNIQAGRIYILSTEDGVGVKMDSNLTTNVDDITFDTNGNIQINKEIISQQQITIKTTKELNNKGAIISKNNNIEIQANTVENNNNALIYTKSGDINITSKQLNNTQKSKIQTSKGNIRLKVDTLNNIGTRNQEIREGDAYSISRYHDYRAKQRAEHYTQKRSGLFWPLFMSYYNPNLDPNPNAKEDQVSVHLTHSPSNITANGNIDIISRTVTNRDSNITASGDITITADTLDNSRESFVVGGLLKEEAYTHYKTERCGFLWLSEREVPYTRWRETSIPNQTHHSNTPSLIAAGKSIKLNVKNKASQDEDIKNKTNYSTIETNRPLPDLNTNHFIVRSRDPSHMFETRPEFLDLSIFEARKKYEEEIQLPKNLMTLGDAQVENEYIKEQIEPSKEEVKTVTTNQDNLNKRIEELITNGIEYDKLHREQISYELTERQIKELERDMIRYERRIINDNEVLVPRLYYTSIDRALESLIEASDNLEITGEAEIINSGKLKGNNITINTTGNITNRAGTIQSNNNTTVKAKNIVNTSITNKYTNGNNITEELVKQGTISGNNITLESTNDIINIGSTIDAKTGTLRLTAGNNISIITQKIHNKIDQGNYKRETLTNIASNIFARDLVVKSTKDTAIVGSNVTVTNNAEIDATNLLISSAENLSYEHTRTEEYSFWRGSKTTTTDSTIITNSKSNLNISNNLKINTKENTDIIGSNLNVTNDIDIIAGNGVNILNVKDRSETITTVERKGGALDSLVSMTVGAVTAVGFSALTGGVGTMAVAGTIGTLVNVNNVTSKITKRTDIDETIVSSNINSNKLTIHKANETNIRSSVIPENNISTDKELNIFKDKEEEHIHKEDVVGERNTLATIGSAALKGIVSGLSIAKGAEVIAGGTEKIINAVGGITMVATAAVLNEKYSDDKKQQQDINYYKEEQKRKRDEMIAKTQKAIEDRVNELDYKINEKRIELINNPDMPIEERNNINQEISQMESEKMRISENGIEMLKALEGTKYNEDGSLKMYTCEAGKDTIGYGHVVTPQERELYKDGITEEQALELLEQDIQKVSRGFDYITTDLNQQQYDALTMFFFNLGPDILNGRKTLDLINGTSRPEVKYKTLEEEFKEFINVRKPGGGYNESPGLKNRRNKEWNLFERGEYCFDNQCFDKK